MKYPYHSIVVTGIGCVLPGARDVDSYWNLINKEQKAYSRLSKDRWDQSKYENDKIEDYIPSFLAGWVEEEFLYNFSKEKYLRSERMVLEALAQAKKSSGINRFPEASEVVLGCMNLDEEVASALILRQSGYESAMPFKERAIHSLESYRSSSLFQALHDEFQLPKTGLFVDTACASSLTAIDLAVDLLLSREKDCVVTGGVEASLGPETYLPFAKLGVLSKGKSCPFDSESDGIVQAEGSVIFILERAESAIKRKAKIFAVIGECEGIATARHSHLLSPDLDTQRTLFEKMNQRYQSKKINFIEAHATGTQIGDGTELKALNDSFKHHEPVALGSVKTLIGHTKATAGAASLLKVILAMEHKTIPPSSQVIRPLIELNSLYFPKTPLEILEEDIHCRVNSGGFGGSNYQLAVLKSAHYEWEDSSPPQPTNSSVTVGHSLVKADSVEESFIEGCLQIPPHASEMMDNVQKATLVAVAEALERSLISFKQLPSSEILLIYATHTGGFAQQDFTVRARLLEWQGEKDSVWEEKRKKIFRLNEDTPGSLDSMTAGRVASEFQLKGPAFHLDAAFQSEKEALRIAKLKIERNRAKVVIVVSANHEKIENTFLTRCPTVSCHVLASKEVAVKMNWKTI